MDILYIVMPAYNEAANIKNTIQSWYPILNGMAAESKIVIADSGSTDETHSILLELQKEYPSLEILSNTEKQHGPKLISLYQYAISKGADYIFQTDSDGQTNPDEFIIFWQMRNKYDVICGHRQVRGDGKPRAFVENVVCLLLKFYFGIKVPDANAPFRLMYAKTLQKYIHRLPENYNLPNIMLTAYFVYYKENIAFHKITFNSRQGGKNSINFFRIAKIGMNALHDFKKFKKEMQDNSSKDISV